MFKCFSRQKTYCDSWIEGSLWLVEEGILSKGSTKASGASFCIRAHGVLGALACAGDEGDGKDAVKLPNQEGFRRWSID